MKLSKILPKTSNSHQIWDNRQRKWRNTADEAEVRYAVIYGDPRGDSFLKEFETEEDFNKGMYDHIFKKDTGCDFATELYLLVKNGEEYTPTIN